MRTRLTLIRHGHTENDEAAIRRLVGQYDVPLSARGRDEAHRLQQRLNINSRFDVVYTSPLRRAHETAQVIVVGNVLDLALCSGLQEIDCGILDGMPIDEIRRGYPDLWTANMRHDDDRFRWPGGESYREFRGRALHTVRRVVRDHPGAHVALVTHAGFISQILGAIHQFSPARWDLYRPTNASLTLVEWARRSRTVLSFDDNVHLLSSR